MHLRRAPVRAASDEDAAATAFVDVDHIRPALDFHRNGVLRDAAVQEQELADYTNLRIGLARLYVARVEDHKAVARRRRDARQVEPRRYHVSALAVLADGQAVAREGEGRHVGGGDRLGL